VGRAVPGGGGLYQVGGGAVPDHLGSVM